MGKGKKRIKSSRGLKSSFKPSKSINPNKDKEEKQFNQLELEKLRSNKRYEKNKNDYINEWIHTYLNTLDNDGSQIKISPQWREEIIANQNEYLCINSCSLDRVVPTTEEQKKFTGYVISPNQEKIICSQQLRFILSALLGNSLTDDIFFDSSRKIWRLFVIF